MFDTLAYVVDDRERRATIRLDRPDKLNAMNQRMIDELQEAMDEACADDDVRAIVLTGSEGVFSAGYDISHDDADDDPVPSVDDMLEHFAAETKHVNAVWDAKKPVIAAVEGHCLAGGSDLAMACDMVIAAEGAEFGYPGVRMGGVPPTLVYPFVMNLHETKELLMTGKIVDAERADDLGMVNRVVPSDDLADVVADEVASIRKMPGNNVWILKRVINGTAEMQGARPMLSFSELFDTLGHHTEHGKEYYRIVAEDGLSAGLAYMNDLDKGMRGPPEGEQ